MKIHVKIQNKTYTVHIDDVHSRPIQVDVDGEDFEVWPEEMTIPRDTTALPSTTTEPPTLTSVRMEEPIAKAANQIKQVKAPIPGVITSISIKEGDKVKFGQELCVLEAMKMKNAIRANREGVIAQILIAEGDSVQHSQVLMEFSD